MICRRPGVRALASIVILAGLGLASDATADEPRQVSSKDGIFKGITPASPNGASDTLHLMCKLDLSYALWTLLGEPVQDYLFRWQACSDDDAKIPALGMTFRAVKREFPQLTKELDGLTPRNVVLRGTVRFYESPSGGSPFASGTLDINPDLYAASGRAENFSVPESPSWDSWFVDFSSSAPASSLTKQVPGSAGQRCSTLCPRAESQVSASCGSRFSKVACNCNESASPPYATLEYNCGSSSGLAAAFRRAKRVEIADLKVRDVVWPSIDGVVRTVTEAKEKARREAEKKLSADSFWGSVDKAPISAAERSTSSSSASASVSGAEDVRKKAREKFAKSMTSQLVSDASWQKDFGVNLSKSEAWRATVDGAARPVENDRLALSTGKHHIVLAGGSGQYAFDADCNTHKEQRERACQDKLYPGLNLLRLCSEVGGKWYEADVRKCQLSGFKFEMPR